MNCMSGTTCPNCHTKLDSDALFCTECGMRVTEVGIVAAGAVVAKRCANCNTPLDDDAAFCTECGMPVATMVNSVPADGLTCLVCGAPLPNDAIYCVRCGAKVEEKQASTDPNPGPCLANAPTASIESPSTEKPRIVNSNEDDAETDQKMKRYFYLPGNIE